MKNVYEAPKAEKLAFDFTNTVVASGGEGGGSGNKTPGHGCSTMPNGKDVPGGAQGHEYSKQNAKKCTHI